MSQEDDLRGLAKVMDFMRALSVLFAIVNVYWFCYPSMKEWNIDIGVVDRILLNFQRTTGLFSSILWTKLFALVFLALSCLGTKGVKEEKIRWAHIWAALACGIVLFFFNWWLLALPLPLSARTGFYLLTLSAGYGCLLAAGVWMSRLLKQNLMEDVFNNENESFKQETRLIENEYSVNLPTRFWYRKKICKMFKLMDSKTGDKVAWSISEILLAESVEIAGGRKIAPVGDFKWKKSTELDKVHYLFLALFQYPFVRRYMEMFAEQAFESGIGISAKVS